MMSETTIAVMFLLLSASSGYLAARRAESFTFWAHRVGASAVLCLAWLALPHDRQSVRSSAPTVDDRVLSLYASYLQQARNDLHEVSR